jgi:hypothetical protein
MTAKADDIAPMRCSMDAAEQRAAEVRYNRRKREEEQDDGMDDGMDDGPHWVGPPDSFFEDDRAKGR